MLLECRIQVLICFVASVKTAEANIDGRAVGLSPGKLVSSIHINFTFFLLPAYFLKHIFLRVYSLIESGEYFSESHTILQQFSFYKNQLRMKK